jgi:hypothetical protein
MQPNEMAKAILSGEILTALSPAHRKCLNDYIKEFKFEIKGLKYGINVIEQHDKMFVDLAKSLEQKLAVAVEALDFYVDTDSYNLGEFGQYICEEDLYYNMGSCGCSPICRCPKIGGKHAKEELARIRE